MKSRVLFLLAVLVGSLNISAQNLVPNGSFEEGSECPMFFDDLHFQCNDWYKSIQEPGVPMNENPSPDWYHDCSEVNDLMPPDFVYGYQEPSDGLGFAALINFDLIIDDNREIIGVQLTEPLQIGEEYYLSFDLATEFSALNTGMATDKFGFKLTTYPIFTSSDQAVNNESQGFISEVFSDTTGWTQYNFQFVADSAFEYIHFGGFYRDDQLQVVNFGDPVIARLAYLLIDNIQLSNEPLSVGDYQHQGIVSIYPNPCTDRINITIADFQNDSYRIKLYNKLGVLLKEITLRNRETSIYVGDLPKGFYILHLVLNSREFNFRTIVKI